MSDTVTKPFTGRHMALIMCAFFGVVISVNLFMAWNASSSWSGLVVPNTYVASQQFNGKVAQQRAIAATGVEGRLSVEDGVVTFRISHPQKGPVDVEAVSVNFLRPVGTGQDFTIDLQRTESGVYSARHEVRPGQWIAAIKATNGEQVIVHEANRFYVVGEQK